MSKIAFIFPGQGAQFPGMGKGFDSEVFDIAEKLCPGIRALCFDGDPAELKLTKNAQPCLYMAETAAAEALVKGGLKPDMVAGFSFGEIVALAFAGVFDMEKGFEIAKKRGELMSESAPDTGMAAILKLPDETVEEICALHGIYPVNYNCPGQVSVSGKSEALKEARPDFIAAGGRYAPLAVSGAFHSPFMSKAALGFADFLDGIDMKKPEIPVYSNLDAEVYGDNIKERMSNQIDHPVYWTKLIKNMNAAGAEIFIEVGPGDTLTKLGARILPEAKFIHVSTPEEVTECLTEFSKERQ